MSSNTCIWPARLPKLDASSECRVKMSILLEAVGSLVEEHVAWREDMEEEDEVQEDAVLKRWPMKKPHRDDYSRVYGCVRALYKFMDKYIKVLEDATDQEVEENEDIEMYWDGVSGAIDEVELCMMNLMEHPEEALGNMQLAEQNWYSA